MGKDKLRLQKNHEIQRALVAETVARNESLLGLRFLQLFIEIFDFRIFPNLSKPVVYKKSHCTLTALMTQIETYCGCYISYMNDIERYINTTSNVKRKILNSGQSFKKVEIWPISSSKIS